MRQAAWSGLTLWLLWQTLPVPVCIAEQIRPSWQEIAPGLGYGRHTAVGPLSVHILEIDPRRIRIRAARALNEGIGRETVSSFAARTGSIAAVNGGFFRIGGRLDGEPDGILKIRDSWFSDPNLARGALGWMDSGASWRIARLSMRWWLQLAGREFPIHGINRPRAPEEAILYTWSFHRSTLTDPGGYEVAIQNDRVSGVVRSGDSPIPVDGYVYSVGGKATVSLEGVKKRSPVRLHHKILEEEGADKGQTKDWDDMDYIVGGVPVLIRRGAVLQDFDAEKARESFIHDRHPRTAIGVRADGNWLFAVVDGRQLSLSVGMTIPELAAFMYSLGCIAALNLDGGGSSTMVVLGEVKNSPSDSGSERPVGDAILLLPR